MLRTLTLRFALGALALVLLLAGLALRYTSGYSGGVPSAGSGQALRLSSGQDSEPALSQPKGLSNESWYTWDATDLVRAWVRGEQPNYGLVLRDATGWEDDHLDWRTFVSSQATTDPSRRPKLTVVYNPDVPFANAGPDQENLSWAGGPVTLDGSASHDRPGGDDASLTYTWRIVQAAFGATRS